MNHRHMSQADLYRGEVNQGTAGQPPKTLKCWSASGNLTTGNPDSEVGLQATFDVAGSYTVQIGAQFPASTGLNPIQAEATVRWSVAGNTVTRKLTPGNGVSITASAEGVTVSVKDVTDLLGTPSTYNIIITVSPGARANTSSPPVLYPPLNAGVTSALGVNGTFDTDIPQNAGVTSVQVTVGDSTGVVIPDNAIVVQQMAPAPLGVLKVYDPRTVEWAPVQPAATFIRVRATGAPAITFITVAFGVDG